ncbi:MAG: D-aminoacyl-tRNA deacylase [Opitutales bacterium]
MMVVLQRVHRASVRRKDGTAPSASIGRGYVLLVGIAAEDGEAEVRRLAAEVAKVRLMEDMDGKMGLNLRDAGGEVLAVSQFTLLADFSKGNRPSFHRAAKAGSALPLFDLFVELLQKESGVDVRTGFFGSDMEVEILNDGPVTVVLY